MTADALIAQKRAEIAAKLAAMKSAASTPTLPTPAAKSSNSPSPAPPAVDDLARRVAEAQRRVAESQSRLAIKENPYMVSLTKYPCLVLLTRLRLQSLPQTGKKSKPTEPAQQGVGLKMAAHPLLLDTSVPAPQSKKDRYKPMQPKFASIKVSTGPRSRPKILTDITRLIPGTSQPHRRCPQSCLYLRTLPIHMRLGRQRPRMIKVLKGLLESGLEGRSGSIRRASTCRLETR